MMRYVAALIALSAAPYSPISAQPTNYQPLPPGTKCVVINTTNSGSINLTCNMAREHEDGIKQKGYEVGQARGFRNSADANIVTFDSIVASEDYDENADFEYRGMTIGGCRAGAEGMQGSFGQITQRSFGAVSCSRRQRLH